MTSIPGSRVRLLQSTTVLDAIRHRCEGNKAAGQFLPDTRHACVLRDVMETAGCKYVSVGVPQENAGIVRVGMKSALV